jgi:hypothetical protein
MADYYYASVTNYVTTSKGNISNCTDSHQPKKGNSIQANTSNIIWYIIDVYHTTDSAYSTIDEWVAYYTQHGSFPGTLLNNPGGNTWSAQMNPNTSDEYIVVNGVPVHTNAEVTAEGGDPFVNGGLADISHSHGYFNITHTGSKESGVSSPTTPIIKVTLQDSPSTNVHVFYTCTRNTSGPTCLFNANVKGPTFPQDNILNWLTLNNPPTGSLGLTIAGWQWVSCKNAFYVNITYVTDKFGTVNTVWIFDEYGLKLVGPKPGVPALNTKAIKNWNATNTAIFLSAQTGTICNSATNPGDSGGTAVGSVPTPPISDERYNPPPHIFARSISYGERMRTYQDASGKPLSAAAVKALAAEIPAPKERGRIIQDPNGASALNKNFDKIPFPGGSKDLWGFRFMYNPTTFSYSTSSNNAVDWTLGSSDPATLLAGNQTVNFDLYLNRIPDMSYLKDLHLDPSSVPSLTSVYGRALNPDTEIPGILNRGTEYDIEFLYRVVNGDPLKNPLLFDKSYKNGYTADFGYTTATPCWLYLNKNMRYFGSVASLSVNHVMFDLNMVPMLSVVSIAFSRYPALWNDNNTPNAKYVNNSNNIMTAINGSTTSTTTTPGG